MKKVLTVIFLIYLFASCSNLPSKTEQNFSREKWKFFVSEVKEALEEKKIENLQEKISISRISKTEYSETGDSILFQGTRVQFPENTGACCNTIWR